MSTIDEILPPDWAIGTTNEIQPGAQLCTRDGRRTGNAVVTGPLQLSIHGTFFWPVITDAGNVMRLTTSEIDELFYPPKWLMDIGTAPGMRHIS